MINFLWVLRVMMSLTCNHLMYIKSVHSISLIFIKQKNRVVILLLSKLNLMIFGAAVYF